MSSRNPTATREAGEPPRGSAAEAALDDLLELLLVRVGDVLLVRRGVQVVDRRLVERRERLVDHAVQLRLRQVRALVERLPERVLADVARTARREGEQEDEGDCGHPLHGATL